MSRICRRRLSGRTWIVCQRNVGSNVPIQHLHDLGTSFLLGVGSSMFEIGLFIAGLGITIGRVDESGFSVSISAFFFSCRGNAVAKVTGTGSWPPQLVVWQRWQSS